MSKRRFRATARSTSAPDYPTLEHFDRSSRRGFLAQLGGTLLGAGALAAGLSACGGRSLKGQPDQGQMMGEPPLNDARIDGQLASDAGPVKPDQEIWMGEAPEPDARVDAKPQPDMMDVTGGVAPPPPAKADAGPEWGVDGDVAQPDARVDDMSWAGGKPGPGAKLDGGSCPP